MREKKNFTQTGRKNFTQIVRKNFTQAVIMWQNSTALLQTYSHQPHKPENSWAIMAIANKRMKNYHQELSLFDIFMDSIDYTA